MCAKRSSLGIITAIILFFAIGVYLPGPIFANEKKESIIVGQSGDMNVYGSQSKIGAKTYFKFINDNKGGIKGKKIQFISYNDQNNPSTCVENTKKLILQDKADILFAYTDIETSRTAVPIAIQNKIPFFAPLTGAQFLRQPFKKYIFNIRASYYQEAESIIERLLEETKARRISVFYEDNLVGKIGLEGVRLALEKRKRVVLNAAKINPNSVNVADAVNAFITTKPDAIILISHLEPTIKLIMDLRKKGAKSLFVSLSTINSMALGKALTNYGIGIVISQVVPFPYDRKLPVIKEYQKLTRKYSPGAELTLLSLEGFIAAKSLSRILLDMNGPYTTDEFIKSAENQFDADFGGFSFTFGPNNHQGSNQVYFSQIGPGGFVAPIKGFTDLYKFNADSFF